VGGREGGGGVGAGVFDEADDDVADFGRGDEVLVFHPFDELAGLLFVVSIVSFVEPAPVIQKVFDHGELLFMSGGEESDAGGGHSSIPPVHVFLHLDLLDVEEHPSKRKDLGPTRRGIKNGILVVIPGLEEGGPAGGEGGSSRCRHDGLDVGALAQGGGNVEGGEPNVELRGGCQEGKGGGDVIGGGGGGGGREGGEVLGEPLDGLRVAGFGGVVADAEAAFGVFVDFEEVYLTVEAVEELDLAVAGGEAGEGVFATGFVGGGEGEAADDDEGFDEVEVVAEVGFEDGLLGVFVLFEVVAAGLAKEDGGLGVFHGAGEGEGGVAVLLVAQVDLTEGGREGGREVYECVIYQSPQTK